MAEDLALAIGGIGGIIGASNRQCPGWVMTDQPEPRTDSSFELLLEAKRGNTAALDKLCARYLPRLRRWAHGRLPRSSRGVLDTDDLAQDVLFQAVSHVDRFEPRHEGAFQGYVRQTLLNRVRDEIRRTHRRPAATTLEDEWAASDPSPLEEAIGRQALERYEEALQRLSPQDRDLVIARVELGFSGAEIAEAFDKPSSAAAHMAVSRALMRLARELSHA